MKRISVVTATRAEYGLLKPIIIKLQQKQDLDVRVVVTGTHLSPEFGYTVSEIEADGIHIDKKIEILLSADSEAAVSKSMGLAMISFSDYFRDLHPDAVLVLGDRYESLAICAVAMIARIPIFHMNGGEATEGLIDEAVRHAITKMSYLHFASTEVFRKRIIQMGEEPERVFNVGAMGVENALHEELLSMGELEQSLGFKLSDKLVIGTFHPVTLENQSAERQINELLKVIESRQDELFLFTKANADANGRIINQLLKEYELKHSNLRLVDSLGVKRYLSCLKYANYVIGNSSSGLMEVPSFGIPTINIGDRQKGRIKGMSVIDCDPLADCIQDAIMKAENKEFRAKIEIAENPYGDGNTSKKIVSIITDYLFNDKIDIKKRFFDIAFEVK